MKLFDGKNQIPIFAPNDVAVVNGKLFKFLFVEVLECCGSSPPHRQGTVLQPSGLVPTTVIEVSKIFLFFLLFLGTPFLSDTQQDTACQGLHF